MIIGFCKNCRRKFRKRETKYKFCSLKCANSYNRNGLSLVHLPKHNSDLAEFIGVCLGDGCTSRFQVTVFLNSIADKEYIFCIISLIKRLFPGATTSVFKRKNYNMVDIKINSVTVSQFMKKNGIVSNAKFIPNWILKRPIYIKSCIRGLFDTEGSISFKQYESRLGVSLYKQLNFRNNDIQLMTFVRDNLLKLDFKPTVTLKQSLYLSTHEGINKFSKLIGFSNPKLNARSKIETIEQYHRFFR